MSPRDIPRPRIGRKKKKKKRIKSAKIKLVGSTMKIIIEAPCI